MDAEAEAVGSDASAAEGIRFLAARFRWCQLMVVGASAEWLAKRVERRVPTADGLWML